MVKKLIATGIASALMLSLFSSCNSTPSAAELSEPVALTITGGWTDCRALEESAHAFTAKYPNCTIKYEFLQDYNASLTKRLSGKLSSVDMFFTTNIQEDSELLPYAQDLNALNGLDLSSTFDGLIENFTYREADTDNPKLYAVPLGSEMRGMYVNTTFLNTLGINVPTNQQELLAACETLKKEGYIAFHGNPGEFSHMLIYPWICNLIANSENPEDTYATVEARKAGISELFRKPFEFLYSLVENGYYDYKKAQTDLNLFNDSSEEDYARHFLNIALDGDDYKKIDDIGQIAFIPSPMSLNKVIEKTKEDYHSNIEYVFVPSPIGEEGGFVYLSPAHGIAVNKNSANSEWCVKFLNYLFTPENNVTFTKAFNVMPNTTDAFTYISTLYDIPSDRISHLGQVTFTYDFYGMVVSNLVDVSKANNPKYMEAKDDGSISLYSLDYYLQNFEESVKEQ